MGCIGVISLANGGEKVSCHFWPPRVSLAPFYRSDKSKTPDPPNPFLLNSKLLLAAPRSSLCFSLSFKRDHSLKSIFFVRIHTQHTEELANTLESESAIVAVERST